MKCLKLPLLAVLLFSSGCAYVNPFVSDYNIVPLADEIAAGEKMHAEIMGSMTLETNTKNTKTVEGIGNKLVSYLPRKDFDYLFYVVKEDSPNAFTIPGGRIYVHTGLLNFVDSQDALAGVIGHEIGHAYERHPAKSISRAHGFAGLTSILFKGNESKLRQLTLQLIQGGVLSKYGRDDERESDEIGYYLTRRAGYSGDGLLQFLRKLESVSSGGSVPNFLRSHPPTPERIARLEALKQTKETSLIRAEAPLG